MYMTVVDFYCQWMPWQYYCNCMVVVNEVCVDIVAIIIILNLTHYQWNNLYIK